MIESDLDLEALAQTFRQLHLATGSLVSALQTPPWRLPCVHPVLPGLWRQVSRRVLGATRDQEPLLRGATGPLFWPTEGGPFQKHSHGHHLCLSRPHSALRRKSSRRGRS